VASALLYPDDSPRPSYEWYQADIEVVAYKYQLEPGQSIQPNQSILSKDGLLTLGYQSDGNLVLRTNTGACLWSTGTQGTDPGVVAMQTDGNLVVYDASFQPVWSSGTNGKNGAFLSLPDFGNTAVVFRANGGERLWESTVGC